jgi:serine/threonine-protein kinase RIO1
MSKPRICGLCKHPRRAEIDKFLALGSTFREFQKKFRLRKITIWVWSRHRTKCMAAAAEASAPAPEDTASVLDVSMILSLNKKLRQLALRCEKGGRPSQAVIAYAAMSRNLEIMAKYAHLQHKDEGLSTPVFNIIFAEDVAPQVEDVPGSPLELKLSPFDALRAGQQAERDSERAERLETWGKLGKDELPN